MYKNKILIIIALSIGFIVSAIADVKTQSSTDLIKNFEDYPTLQIINHPVIKYKLTIMRDKKTSSMDFKRILGEITMLMGYEVTKDIKTKDIEVETPMVKTKGQKLKEDIVIIPILRAGLGMAEGLSKLIPEANVGHIGLYRDPLTKKAVEYLFRLPEVKDQTFIVVDPMLATGNSAISAIDRLIKTGVQPEKILFMALIAAPEGIKKFYSRYPTIRIYIAALDEKLDDQAYIVPGLGDAGDRLYGTN